jgi:hypothetical protein
MRRRPRREIAVWIRREDYDAFKTLCPNDPDLPDTFDEWLQRATENVTKSAVRGDTVNKVIVDPREFAKWCAAAGVDRNNVTLGGFAVTVARREGKI